MSGLQYCTSFRDGGFAKDGREFWALDLQGGEGRRRDQGVPPTLAISRPLDRLKLIECSRI